MTLAEAVCVALVSVLGFATVGALWAGVCVVGVEVVWPALLATWHEVVGR